MGYMTVGYSFERPFEKKWEIACELPIEVALFWANKELPNVRVGDHTFKEMYENPDLRNWDNEITIAIVIQIGRTIAYALYVQSGTIWVISKALF